MKKLIIEFGEKHKEKRKISPTKKKKKKIQIYSSIYHIFHYNFLQLLVDFGW